MEELYSDILFPEDLSYREEDELTDLELELPLDRTYTWYTDSGKKEYTPEPGDVVFETVAVKPAVNENQDAWTLKELVNTGDTFIGKPLCLNHDYDEPTDNPIGLIVDSFYSVKYNGVICVGIVKEDHPLTQEKIMNGEINSVSMGCYCEESICSICGQDENEIDSDCPHRRDPDAFFLGFGTVFEELSLITGDEKNGYNQAQKDALIIRKEKIK